MPLTVTTKIILKIAKILKSGTIPFSTVVKVYTLDTKGLSLNPSHINY